MILAKNLAYCGIRIFHNSGYTIIGQITDFFFHLNQSLSLIDYIIDYVHLGT